MNLFDYLDHELASFDEKPLNPVDSAILSQFCMVRSEGVAPEARSRRREGLLARPPLDRAADAWHALRARPARFSDYLRAEILDGMFCGLVPERVRELLSRLVASPRFRDLEVRDYATVFDEGAHVQFSATSFVWRSRCGRDFSYVGFRGTDSSFAGWRENFDMAVHPPVPAQDMAVEYLESVSRHLPGTLYVGGHSKGGNLATYAALRCDDATRARVSRVFDHDGPGFKPGFVDDAEFAVLDGRIERTVPQESVVGMLMETPAPTRVVVSDAHGADQHSVFTWQVDGDDFQLADGLAESARFAHDVMGEWLASFSPDEAREVIDATFRAIEASGAKDAAEVLLGGPKSLALLVEAAKVMDERDREVVMPALGKLAGIASSRAARGVLGALARPHRDGE